MKLSRLLIFLIVIIWLSAAVTFVLVKGYNKELVINEFGMDATIVEKGIVGLNADVDAVHFGTVTWGGGSTRSINVTNSEDYDAFIYLEKDSSKLSSLVRVDSNYFTLKGNSYKSVEVSLSVPEGFEVGNYTGKIRVIKRVPFYRR